MNNLHNAAVTKLNTISCTDTWTITNPEIIQSLPDGLLSPVLLHEEICPAEYHISIRNYTNIITVGFYFLQNLTLDTPLNIVIEFNNMIRTSIIHRVHSSDWNELVTFDKNFRKQWPTFMLKFTLTRTIYITKSLCSVKEKEQMLEIEEVLEDDKPALITSLAMFKDPELSDMTIYVKQKPFYIHKSIVSCYPYFKNLILETKSLSYESIHIDDVEPHIFKYILDYMYTGDDKDLKSGVLDCLPTITKFGIHTLQKQYLKFLQDELTINNLIDTLTTINEINEPNVMPYIKNFIIKYIVGIKKSKVYNELKEFYPDIMIQILEDVMTL